MTAVSAVPGFFGAPGTGHGARSLQELRCSLNINLEYYKIFYYVARQGSVTAAAAGAFRQPACCEPGRARQSGILPRGIPLFVRTGKGVRLTPAGEILYSYVQNGYETILRGEKKLREMKGLESGELRIGASDMTLRFFLLPYLQKFHEAYPKIKITVTNGPTPETLRYMQEGRIDFGVVTSPVTGHEEVNVYRAPHTGYLCGGIQILGV